MLNVGYQFVQSLLFISSMQILYPKMHGLDYLCVSSRRPCIQDSSSLAYANNTRILHHQRTS